jgi:FAD/FMN-containing dehydrogenase
MTLLTTLDGDKLQLDEDTFGGLRVSLRGPLLAPEAPGFDEACRIWNAMIPARPGLVVQPTGTADIVAGVQFARQHKIGISAKGGGHNIAGTCLVDGGMTLDLSRMRGVLVDPGSRIARVQAGCLLGDVDRETQLFGLATPLGFVSETGVAGLTVGGGFGYLTRRFGWTVDNLLEMEVVTADGEIVRASEDTNADLFWALRGGGGNFGIVTAFTFKLHALGPKVTGGLIIWPGEHAEEVLAKYREATETAPRELTLAAAVRMAAPPAPFIPKDRHGKPWAALIVCHSGSKAQAESDLAALRGFGKPMVDLIGEMPYVKLQSLLDATQPKGVCYYWKSEFLPKLSATTDSLMNRHAMSATSPMSQIVLFHIGGALAERSADDGAVGNRDAEYMLGIQASWPPDDKVGQPHVQWARAAWQELRSHSTGGVYVNFLTAEEGEDRVRAAYKDNYGRLAQVKAKFDPNNLFRSNKNIAPAS